jgi:hypothetical protein
MTRARFVVAIAVSAFLARPITAQGFAATITRADAEDSSGHHAEAAKLYEQAYAMSGFDPSGLALAAESFAAAGNTAAAFRDLGRAIDQGFLHLQVFGDTAFNHVTGDPQFKALRARMQRKIAALDASLRTELIGIAARDQQNRATLNQVMTKYGAKSPQGDSALRSLGAADYPLQQRVKAIIAEKGWPGRSLVGDDGAHAAWLVVQHMNATDQVALLPKLQAAVKAGEAQAGDGALLEDRVLVAQHQPQRYGTQLKYSPNGGPPTLDPIADEACVDARRRSVGLEPLESYLKGFGVEWHAKGTCRAPS